MGTEEHPLVTEAYDLVYSLDLELIFASKFMGADQEKPLYFIRLRRIREKAATRIERRLDKYEVV